jgi:hypothetical protein
VDAAHASHDRLVIARLVADDLHPDELDAARALVEQCPACEALASELRSISMATAQLPAPRRTRDFRITPEQAASLRGTWWQRAVRALSAPRLAVLQPLAGTAVAIGLVLVVLGSGVLPLSGSSPASDADLPDPTQSAETARISVSAPSEPAPAAAPTAGPTVGVAQPGDAAASAPPATRLPVPPDIQPEATAMATGAAGPDQEPTSPEGRTDGQEATQQTPAATAAPTLGGQFAAPQTPGPSASQPPAAPDRLLASPEASTAPAASGGEEATASGSRTDLPLMAGGAALALLGAVILALRLSGRRATRS